MDSWLCMLGLSRCIDGLLLIGLNSVWLGVLLCSISSSFCCVLVVDMCLGVVVVSVCLGIVWIWCLSLLSGSGCRLLGVFCLLLVSSVSVLVDLWLKYVSRFYVLVVLIFVLCVSDVCMFFLGSRLLKNYWIG